MNITEFKIREIRFTCSTCIHKHYEREDISYDAICALCDNKTPKWEKRDE